MTKLGNEFTEEEIELYSRQIVLSDIGLEGQEKLKRAKVAIVGIGGLGCPTAVTLAAMGVGYLRIVDRDVVEKSNLHRQHLYGYNDVNYPKVEVAAKRLKELNPYIEVDPFPIYVDEVTAGDVVEGVDLVIDGLDNITARKALNKACVKNGVPYLFSAAIQTYGVISMIIPGETACLECIYPNITDEELPTCSVVGVHPAILQFISSVQVLETTNYIVKSKPLLKNKLFFCDLKTLSIETIQVKRVDYCPVCGTRKGIVETREETYPMAEEVCGREGVTTFIINPGRMNDISIAEVKNAVKGINAEVIALGEFGLTLKYRDRLKISLLRSGVAVIEGAKSREEALKIYKFIIKAMKI